MDLIDYISVNPYNYSDHISLAPINKTNSNNQQYVLFAICQAFF